MMKKTHKINSWSTIKFLLAVGLITFVIKKTDFAYLSLLGERLSWTWLALRTALFFVLILIKAFQYHALIGNTRYRNVLNIVGWQNAISNFISNSVGIASYMTMLKSEQNVKLTRSGTTFVITKFGDLLAICLYLGLSTWMVWRHIQPMQWLTILLIIVILLGLGTFLLTILWREYFVSCVERIATWLKLDSFSLMTRGLEVLRLLAKEEQKKIFTMLWKGVLISLIYMTVSMVFAYTVVGIFDLPLGIWEPIYVMSLLQLVSFVPIQVLGGLGVSEVTIVYLYGLFGIAQVEMSAIALGLRAIFYLMNAMILLYLSLDALLQRSKNGKDTSHAE